MKKSMPRLTYANVVATLALFLVLTGGAAYGASRLAKNSVGTKQLKNRAITAAKIKNGAVTGTKVNLSTLGQVPSASHANSADSATHADSATQATSASTAADSAALGGVGPAGYQGRTMWAYVGGGGSQILSQSGGISVQAHIKGGTWLHFPQPVSGKGIVATPWAGDQGYEDSVEVAPCGYVSETATVGSLACDHGTNTLSDLFVGTENEGTGANLSFYVVVVP